MAAATACLLTFGCGAWQRAGEAADLPPQPLHGLPPPPTAAAGHHQSARQATGAWLGQTGDCQTILPTTTSRRCCIAARLPACLPGWPCCLFFLLWLAGCLAVPLPSLPTSWSRSSSPSRSASHLIWFSRARASCSCSPTGSCSRRSTAAPPTDRHIRKGGREGGAPRQRGGRQLASMQGTPYMPTMGHTAAALTCHHGPKAKHPGQPSLTHAAAPSDLFNRPPRRRSYRSTGR